MINEPATTIIIRREVKNASGKLLIRAMSLINEPTEEIISWNSRLQLDFENDTDINPVNYLLFNDTDVTSLTTWFQGLADHEYRLRRYTLSLVIGCHVDGEAHLTHQLPHRTVRGRNPVQSTSAIEKYGSLIW